MLKIEYIGNVSRIRGWSTLSIIRIGTRGSKLALWQAEWVAAQLRELGYVAQLQIITTSGDVSSQPLSQVGGQGLFTKEIQRELLQQRVDVAVHSLKDLPTVTIPGLCLAAIPPRETTADVLVARDGSGFADLSSGAKVGTGSSRRSAQLKHWRSDIDIVDIRGNVDSRLAKLDRGEFDAIVLSAAGLTRLGIADRITEHLPVERVLPAVGQGALGLECREDDSHTRDALAKLNHTASQAEVTAERSLLLNLLAGCLAPVAARGTVSGNRLELVARVLSLDGRRVVSGATSGDMSQANTIGEQLAGEMMSQGAGELIAASRGAQ